MSRWRAGTVQAWLEVIMAMPMYIRACADNVKSGKVRRDLVHMMHKHLSTTVYKIIPLNTQLILLALNALGYVNKQSL